MQIAVGDQPGRQKADETGLDQTALVMPRLVPGIGKENMDAVQRIFRDHVLEHFDSVVLDEPDIRQFLFTDQFQQTPYTGCVDFYADEIHFRPVFGDGCGGFTHPETDFKHRFCFSAEKFFIVECFLDEGKNKVRSEFPDSPFLTGGQASGTSDETAYTTDFGVEKEGVAGGMENGLV